MFLLDGVVLDELPQRLGVLGLHLGAVPQVSPVPTVQNSTIQYRTVQYSTVQYSIPRTMSPAPWRPGSPPAPRPRSGPTGRGPSHP